MFDLKQWAAERKMTQKQIAQMSGTSTQPISALMNDGHCLEAVSYTHLDVYKRQGII